MNACSTLKMLLGCRVRLTCSSCTRAFLVLVTMTYRRVQSFTACKMKRSWIMTLHFMRAMSQSIRPSLTNYFRRQRGGRCMRQRHRSCWHPSLQVPQITFCLSCFELTPCQATTDRHRWCMTPFALQELTRFGRSPYQNFIMVPATHAGCTCVQCQAATKLTIGPENCCPTWQLLTASSGARRSSSSTLVWIGRP